MTKTANSGKTPAERKKSTLAQIADHLTRADEADRDFEAKTSEASTRRRAAVDPIETERNAILDQIREIERQRDAEIKEKAGGEHYSEAGKAIHAKYEKKTAPLQKKSDALYDRMKEADGTVEFPERGRVRIDMGEGTLADVENSREMLDDIRKGVSRTPTTLRTAKPEKVSKESAAKAISGVAAYDVDDSRKVLKRVNFEDGKVVATDGRILMAVDVPDAKDTDNPKDADPYPDWNRVVPKEKYGDSVVFNIEDAWKKATRARMLNHGDTWEGSMSVAFAIPGGKGKPGRLEFLRFDDKGRVTFSTTDDIRGGKFVAPLDAELFTKLLKAGAGVGERSFKLSFDAANKPIRLDGERSMALQMPLRTSGFGFKTDAKSVQAALDKFLGKEAVEKDKAAKADKFNAPAFEIGSDGKKKPIAAKPTGAAAPVEDAAYTKWLHGLKDTPKRRAEYDKSHGEKKPVKRQPSKSKAQVEAMKRLGVKAYGPISDLKAELARVSGLSDERSLKHADDLRAAIAYREKVKDAKPKEGKKFAGSTEEISALSGIRDAASYKKSLGNKIDKNGNPLDENGKLKVDEVEKISDISDSDFTSPTRTIKLPDIPKNVDAAIGANGKSVIIKKNIFEKNRKNHPELDSATSKSILERSLYNPNLIGQSQPITKPNYKVAVQTGDRNAVTILDVEQDKDHVEIVGWRNIDEDGFERLKRQAAREGGQFLILRPSEEGQPGALSGRPSGLTAGSIAKSAEEVKTVPPRRFKRLNEDEWGTNAHITLGKERNDIFLDEDGYIEDFGEVKRAFQHLNRDATSQKLAERVFEICDRIGMDALALSEKPDTYGWNVGNIVALNPNFFNDPRNDAQKKAETILHECIHAVTSYALDIVEGRNPDLKDIKLTKELTDAVHDLEVLYDRVHFELERDKDTNYATSTELADSLKEKLADDPEKLERATKFARMKELIAELANPDVRKKLKETKVWTRIIDAIRRIFNFFKDFELNPSRVGTETDRQVSALKVSNEILDSFLSNANPELIRDVSDVNLHKARSLFASRKGATPAKPVDVDKPLTFTETWKKKFKDSNVALQSLDKQLGYTDKRGEITDEGRSIWMARTLQPGRVQAGLDRREMFERDIGKLMKDNGITLNDIDDYLLSQAVPERNARLAKSKAVNDGSGLSDADAAKLLSDLQSRLSPEQMKAVRDAADLAWQMQAEGQRMRIDSGRLDQATYDAWQNDEPHHVPMRDDYSDVDGEWTRRSNGYKKREFATAEGRTTRSDSPLVFMFREFSEAVTGSEDNLVRQKIAEAVRQHKELGKVHSASRGEGGVVVLNGNAGPGVQIRTVRENRRFGDGGDPNILLFKENGELRAIEMNGEVGERVAAAMLNRDVADFGTTIMPKAKIPGTDVRISDVIKGGSRIWANTATAWSPTFGVGNLAKDKIENDIHGIADFGIVGGLKNAVKGYKTIPVEAKPIFDYIRTRKFDTSTERGRLIKRFVEAGGQIGGGAASEGYSEIEKTFDGFADQSASGKAKRLASAITKPLRFYNESMELLNRINNFKNATDSGMSDRAAALKSRLDSTDFNQFGDYKWMNTIWNFSNSVTGGTLRQATKLLGKHGWKIAATLATLGFAEGMAEVLMNGDDDEREKRGEPTGKDMTEYDRINSLYVRVGGRKYSLPIHAGWYSTLKYVGNGLARVLTGNLSGETYAANLYDEVVATLKHYTGTGDVSGGREDELPIAQQLRLPDIAQSFSPSVLQPLVQIKENKTYRGTPLRPKVYDESKPLAYNGRRNTPEVYKAVAQWSNDLFGGNKSKKSAGDMSPENLRALFEGVTKNLGKDAVNTADLVTRLVSGKEIEPNTLPFGSRFVRDIPENDSRYYEALRQYDADRKEYADADGKRKSEIFREKRYVAGDGLRSIIKRIEFYKRWEEGRLHQTDTDRKDGHFIIKKESRNVTVSDEKKAELQERRRKLQAQFLRAIEKKPQKK